MDLANTESVCLLDSCGVGHLGSHLLIAGVGQVAAVERSDDDPFATLKFLDEVFAGSMAAFFTISYDFGNKLLRIAPEHKQDQEPLEPDLFVATFDKLVIHDYDSNTTTITGHRCRELADKLRNSPNPIHISETHSCVGSNFTKAEYLRAIEDIKELIRDGDTYQTNLTQQLTATLAADLTPELIFHRLRREHPAPFSAYLKRRDSTVVSASPERFFKVDYENRRMTASPIKGTRPRGQTRREDDMFRDQLIVSSKDASENTMIVDLLRNDLGRVCRYGSVHVEKICDLEEHPTLFHLVSTVAGTLRPDVDVSDILAALYPCGSITGAPKISTMKIINRVEPARRGLSMGAIGYYLPAGVFGRKKTLDLSVAIRTMVIRDHTATFNVGGGIVIDSEPETEYEETLIKAKALMAAIGGVITIEGREQLPSTGV
ncbi:MAG: aminodeoxychorismate synthase component I [Pyrinomonadaceae bacterium]